MLPIKDSVVNSSAALLGMLPKESLLTVTSLLTASDYQARYAQRFLSKMYSVETLARPCVLIETGTITQGKMTVESLHSLSIIFLRKPSKLSFQLTCKMARTQSYCSKLFARLMGSWSMHTAENIIPFSSDRKWGAMHLSNGTVFLGALNAPSRKSAAVSSKHKLVVTRAHLDS